MCVCVRSRIIMIVISHIHLYFLKLMFNISSLFNFLFYERKFSPERILQY